ncbi:hypothetical protein LP421_08475 [Rhizobium sp. RCAM05350]|nr:hypothetical protein LP421_08475 [Rhizobium sp. RCAM05350]
MRAKPSTCKDLPEKERSKIDVKLLWVTLLRRKREELGRIPHEMRRIIIRQMRDEYLDDYQAMRRLAYFKTNKKLTYETDEEPALKLPSYESVSAWSLALQRAGGDAFCGIVVAPAKMQHSHRKNSIFRAVSSGVTFLRPSPRPAYLFKLMKAVERRINRSRSKEEQIKVGCRSTFTIGWTPFPISPSAPAASATPKQWHGTTSSLVRTGDTRWIWSRGMSAVSTS